MTGDQIVQLVMYLSEAKDQILVEDSDGHLWDVVRVRALGTRTDDPAILLTVVSA